jgi:hypothetical protein
MTIAEHDLVVLTRDLPERNLRIGDVGTVVHVYAEGKAYEVEFMTGAGQTLALEIPQPGDIRPRGTNEILHVRNLTAT